MAQRQFRSDDTDAWKEGFGDGSAGSSYATPANEGCSGTGGTTTLTLATAGSFSNDDLVLIHQSRGTGVGKWELNKIVSGAGGTSLTMKYDLINTYTDSGNSQAQVIELNQYENLTTGSVTAPAWDGSKGAIIAFFDKGEVTVNGTLSADSRGYTGGNGSGNANITAYSGEGTPGAGSQTGSANGNAGGGGTAGGGNTDGAGGGNGGAGGSAGGGTGGAADGNAALTDMVFGGSGGGTSSDSGSNQGGKGSGIIFIAAKTITVTGTITNDGGAGALNATTGKQGGGGAGGSILLKAEVATLGSSKIGAVGNTSGSGGDGGTGRIHLDYSTSYTGTTSPTINVTNDSTIIGLSDSGGSFLNTFLAFG